MAWLGIINILTMMLIWICWKNKPGQGKNNSELETKPNLYFQRAENGDHT
jgi:hypothetical protein